MHSRLVPGLFWIYSSLSHRAMDYYYGARELHGTGMSKHWPLAHSSSTFWR